jgi:hypothetical protein
MSRKLAFEEILERRVLTPGQSYLTDYLRRAYKLPESPVGIYEHKAATNTCKEKIDLLNKDTSLRWDLEQAIKAPYFDLVEKHMLDIEKGMMYCFVFPEVGRDVDKREVSGLHLMKAKTLLSYMTHGTCTPFIEQGDQRVAGIYIHYDRKLSQKLVDVSIGGTDEPAHRLSLWMPYRAMYKKLQWQFPVFTAVKPLAFKQTEEEQDTERMQQLREEKKRIDSELYALDQKLLKLREAAAESKPLIPTPDKVEA